METMSLKDSKFNAWMSHLAASGELTEAVKAVFLKELRETRHVVIVDMREFFKDISNELDPKYPFILFAKTAPFAFLDCHTDAGEAVACCEEMGVTWDFHLYPTISIRVQ